MNYTINTNQHKIIAKQLKYIEAMVRNKKNILKYMEGTQIPAYWVKRERKIKTFARQSNEVKIAIRERIKTGDSYQISTEEIETIVKVFEDGYALSKTLRGELNSIKKTIKNVMEVLEHEINSHQLQNIIIIKMENIDAIISNVLDVYEYHNDAMEQIFQIKEKA